MTTTPAPLPPELRDPLIAELALIGLKASAAQSALAHGRLPWVRTWCDEIAEAAGRLERAVARAIPPTEPLVP